jgi:hypothetical protein
VSDRVIDDELYRLDPGSAEARAEGCICDEQEPGEVQGRKAWKVEKDCPLHGLAIAKALLDE